MELWVFWVEVDIFGLVERDRLRSGRCLGADATTGVAFTKVTAVRRAVWVQDRATRMA